MDVGAAVAVGAAVGTGVVGEAVGVGIDVDTDGAGELDDGTTLIVGDFVG